MMDERGGQSSSKYQPFHPILPSCFLEVLSTRSRMAYNGQIIELPAMYSINRIMLQLQDDIIRSQEIPVESLKEKILMSVLFKTKFNQKYTDTLTEEEKTRYPKMLTLQADNDPSCFLGVTHLIEFFMLPGLTLEPSLVEFIYEMLFPFLEQNIKKYQEPYIPVDQGIPSTIARREVTKKFKHSHLEVRRPVVHKWPVYIPRLPSASPGTASSSDFSPFLRTPTENTVYIDLTSDDTSSPERQSRTHGSGSTQRDTKGGAEPDQEPRISPETILIEDSDVEDAEQPSPTEQTARKQDVTQNESSIAAIGVQKPPRVSEPLVFTCLEKLALGASSDIEISKQDVTQNESSIAAIGVQKPPRVSEPLVFTCLEKLALGASSDIEISKQDATQDGASIAETGVPKPEVSEPLVPFRPEELASGVLSEIEYSRLEDALKKGELEPSISAIDSCLEELAQGFYKEIEITMMFRSDGSMTTTSSSLAKSAETTASEETVPRNSIDSQDIEIHLKAITPEPLISLPQDWIEEAIPDSISAFTEGPVTLEQLPEVNPEYAGLLFGFEGERLSETLMQPVDIQVVSTEQLSPAKYTDTLLLLSTVEESVLAGKVDKAPSSDSSTDSVTHSTPCSPTERPNLERQLGLGTKSADKVPSLEEYLNPDEGPSPYVVSNEKSSEENNWEQFLQYEWRDMPAELQVFLKDDLDKFYKERLILSIPVTFPLEKILAVLKSQTEKGEFVPDILWKENINSICEFLKDSFNITLPYRLLTVPEHQFYLQHVVHEHPGTVPSELCGTLHLLRLLVRYESILNEREQGQIVAPYSIPLLRENLFKFLAGRIRVYTEGDNYVPVPETEKCEPLMWYPDVEIVPVTVDESSKSSYSELSGLSMTRPRRPQTLRNWRERLRALKQKGRAIRSETKESSIRSRTSLESTVGTSAEETTSSATIPAPATKETVSSLKVSETSFEEAVSSLQVASPSIEKAVSSLPVGAPSTEEAVSSLMVAMPSTEAHKEPSQPTSELTPKVGTSIRKPEPPTGSKPIRIDDPRTKPLDSSLSSGEFPRLPIGSKPIRIDDPRTIPLDSSLSSGEFPSLPIGSKPIRIDDPRTKPQDSSSSSGEFPGSKPVTIDDPRTKPLDSSSSGGSARILIGMKPVRLDIPLSKEEEETTCTQTTSTSPEGIMGTSTDSSYCPPAKRGRLSKAASVATEETTCTETISTSPEGIMGTSTDSSYRPPAKRGRLSKAPSITTEKTTTTETSTSSETVAGNSTDSSYHPPARRGRQRKTPSAATRGARAGKTTNKPTRGRGAKARTSTATRPLPIPETVDLSKVKTMLYSLKVDASISTAVRPFPIPETVDLSKASISTAVRPLPIPETVDPSKVTLPLQFQSLLRQDARINTIEQVLYVPLALTVEAILYNVRTMAEEEYNPMYLEPNEIREICDLLRDFFNENEIFMKMIINPVEMSLFRFVLGTYPGTLPSVHYGAVHFLRFLGNFNAIMDQLSLSDSPATLRLIEFINKYIIKWMFENSENFSERAEYVRVSEVPPVAVPEMRGPIIAIPENAVPEVQSENQTAEENDYSLDKSEEFRRSELADTDDSIKPLAESSPKIHQGYEHIELEHGSPVASTSKAPVQKHPRYEHIELEHGSPVASTSTAFVQKQPDEPPREKHAELKGDSIIESTTKSSTEIHQRDEHIESRDGGRTKHKGSAEVSSQMTSNIRPRDKHIKSEGDRRTDSTSKQSISTHKRSGEVTPLKTSEKRPRDKPIESKGGRSFESVLVASTSTHKKSAEVSSRKIAETRPRDKHVQSKGDGRKESTSKQSFSKHKRSAEVTPLKTSEKRPRDKPIESKGGRSFESALVASTSTHQGGAEVSSHMTSQIPPRDKPIESNGGRSFESVLISSASTHKRSAESSRKIAETRPRDKHIGSKGGRTFESALIASTSTHKRSAEVSSRKIAETRPRDKLVQSKGDGRKDSTSKQSISAHKRSPEVTPLKTSEKRPRDKPIESKGGRSFESALIASTSTHQGSTEVSSQMTSQIRPRDKPIESKGGRSFESALIGSTSTHKRSAEVSSRKIAETRPRDKPIESKGGRSFESALIASTRTHKRSAEVSSRKIAETRPRDKPIESKGGRSFESALIASTSTHKRSAEVSSRKIAETRPRDKPIESKGGRSFEPALIASTSTHKRSAEVSSQMTSQIRPRDKPIESKGGRSFESALIASTSTHKRSAEVSSRKIAETRPRDKPIESKGGRSFESALIASTSTHQGSAEVSSRMTSQIRPRDKHIHSKGDRTFESALLSSTSTHKRSAEAPSKKIAETRPRDKPIESRGGRSFESALIASTSTHQGSAEVSSQMTSQIRPRDKPIESKGGRSFESALKASTSTHEGSADVSSQMTSQIRPRDKHMHSKGDRTFESALISSTSTHKRSAEAPSKKIPEKRPRLDENEDYHTADELQAEVVEDDKKLSLTAVVILDRLSRETLEKWRKKLDVNIESKGEGAVAAATSEHPAPLETSMQTIPRKRPRAHFEDVQIASTSRETSEKTGKKKLKPTQHEKPQEAAKRREIAEKSQKSEMHLSLPETLQNIVTEDYIRTMDRNTIIRVPCKITLNSIFQDLLKNTREDSLTYRYSRFRGVIDGLMDIFDEVMRERILTVTEVAQFDKMRRRNETILPRELYGFVHLLRLIIQIEEIYEIYTFSQGTRLLMNKIIMENIIPYIMEHIHTLRFSDKYAAGSCHQDLLGKYRSRC